MKKTLSTLLLILAWTFSNGQVYQVTAGHCKKADMEIVSGNSIPQGYAIAQMGTFEKEDIEGTVAGLTKKQIKTMKTYAKWRNACKIFIAFEQLQTFSGYTPGAEYYEDKVCFYVLVPIWEVEMK